MLIIGAVDSTSVELYKDFHIAAHDEDTGVALDQWVVNPTDLGLTVNFSGRIVVNPVAAVVYLFSGYDLVTYSLVTGTGTVTDMRNYFSPTPTNITVRTGELSPAISKTGNALFVGVRTVGATPAGWATPEGVLRIALDGNGAVSSGAALHVGDANITNATYQNIAASDNGRYAAITVYNSVGAGDRRYYNAVLDFTGETVVVSRYQSEAVTAGRAWGVAISDDASQVYFAQDMSTNRGVFEDIPAASPVVMTDTSIQNAANLAKFEPGSVTRVLRVTTVESDGSFAQVYSMNSLLPAASALIEDCPIRASSSDPGYVGIDAVWRDGPEVLVVRGVYDGGATFEIETARRGPTGAVIGALTHAVPGFSTGFTQTLRVIKSPHSERAAASFTFSPIATYDMYVVLINATTLASTVITPPVLTTFAGSALFGFTSGDLGAPQFWTRVEGAFA